MREGIARAGGAFAADLAHIGREAIAALRYGFDVLRLFAERLAQREDILRQRRFFNEGIRPHGLQQFFFFEYVAVVLNQDDERVESLWRQRHRLFIAQQHALIDVQSKRPEFV